MLVGDPTKRNWLIAAPIILGDFPKVANESPGDLLDSTEIDEILTLRVLTLTDEDTEEAAALVAVARERGRHEHDEDDDAGRESAETRL